jgi:hypothetical protein
MFSNPFDHIHGRDLTTCLKDYVPLFRFAFNALRPGGYFETQDAIIPSGVLTIQWKAQHLKAGSCVTRRQQPLLAE